MEKTERTIYIEETRSHYRFVKQPGKTCSDCDLMKDSGQPRMHHYPLCYRYNTRGKETSGTRGLLVNLCARHTKGLWKKYDPEV